MDILKLFVGLWSIHRTRFALEYINIHVVAFIVEENSNTSVTPIDTRYTDLDTGWRMASTRIIMDRYNRTTTNSNNSILYYNSQLNEI